MAEDALTVKQRAFVDAYLRSGNATAAYVAAGYKATTDKVASANAIKLLGNHKVSAALGAARKALAERNDLSVDRVVGGLVKEAELGGEGASHSARVAAWVALGKHLGMFEGKRGDGRGRPRAIHVEVHLGAREGDDG